MISDHRPIAFNSRFIPLNQRQSVIMEMILHQNFLSVTELAAHFDVTKQTVRRDLNSLCEQNIARRVRGGIKRLTITQNPDYPPGQLTNLGSKKAIAREVACHVPSSISLALSIGTTTEVVCRALLDHDHLKIFTNNLSLSMLACMNPTFEVTIAGGRLRNETKDILGSGMEALFKAYKFDIGIYSAAGVDGDGSLLDFYEEEVRARQIIRQNSREVFLVLDCSRFGRTAHVRGGYIYEATKVFCDIKPSLPICDMIQKNGAQLIVCKEHNNCE